MTGRCRGKVAVVRGTDTPIGMAIAGGLAEAGAVVVAEPDFPDALSWLDRTVTAHGTVDILVNCPVPVHGPSVDDLSEEQFHAFADRYLWQTYQAVQLVSPVMKANRSGWILNVSDRDAVHPMSPMASEGASGTDSVLRGVLAAAVNRMSVAMAAEFHSWGIAVNSLTPAAGDDVESVVKAAIALCSAGLDLTGRVAFAGPLVEELTRAGRDR